MYPESPNDAGALESTMHLDYPLDAFDPSFLPYCYYPTHNDSSVGEFPADSNDSGESIAVRHQTPATNRRKSRTSSRTAVHAGAKARRPRTLRNHARHNAPMQDDIDSNSRILDLWITAPLQMRSQESQQYLGGEGLSSTSCETDEFPTVQPRKSHSAIERNYRRRLNSKFDGLIAALNRILAMQPANYMAGVRPNQETRKGDVLDMATRELLRLGVENAWMASAVERQKTAMAKTTEANAI
ncbi:hypothetical protein G3M48_005342 [Beauveria asiatica]|uniref:BHLH domain-containing protein n=1 Tax=Beauveria asiatica TaxID=1069075 RepID=A0AAW0RSD5_9HYPO